MQYIISAYTDSGTRGKRNQDSLCIRRAALPGGSEAVMAVVCDGMGGLQQGEVASAAAVRTFGKWFDSSLTCLPTLCSDGFAQVHQQWKDILSGLHNRLLAYSERNRVQLGTTLTALFAYGSHYMTVNVGDSRIYEYRNGILRQLTQDQSLVAQEVAKGHITEEQARRHPQRNVLLQCLGVGPAVTPVFSYGLVASEGLYLLCSDGFVHEVSPAELAQALGGPNVTTREALNRILYEVTGICMARGESDNITSLLMKSMETPAMPALRKRRKRQGTDVPQGAVLVETAEIVFTTAEI